MKEWLEKGYRLATQLKQEREEKARLKAENAQAKECIVLQEQEIKQSAPKVQFRSVKIYHFDKNLRRKLA